MLSFGGVRVVAPTAAAARGGSWRDSQRSEAAAAQHRGGQDLRFQERGERCLRGLGVWWWSKGTNQRDSPKRARDLPNSEAKSIALRSSARAMAPRARRSLEKGRGPLNHLLLFALGLLSLAALPRSADAHAELSLAFGALQAAVKASEDAGVTRCTFVIWDVAGAGIKALLREARFYVVPAAMFQARVSSASRNICEISFPSFSGE